MLARRHTPHSEQRRAKSRRERERDWLNGMEWNELNESMVAFIKYSIFRIAQEMVVCIWIQSHQTYFKCFRNQFRLLAIWIFVDAYCRNQSWNAIEIPRWHTQSHRSLHGSHFSQTKPNRTGNNWFREISRRTSLFRIVFFHIPLWTHTHKKVNLH